MLKAHAVSYVDQTEVLGAFGVSDEDCEYFYDQIGDGWTWGDILISLVGRAEYIRELVEVLGKRYPNITEDACWEIVPEDAYIALNG